MDKVLVLGHRGKLGHALMQAFGADCQVEGRSRSDRFDAGDFAQVRTLLETTQPRIVANAIACTGLDACERDPQQAFQLNALLPGYLARCSREMGFLLLHFSSDAVFDGRKETGPYLESDRPMPVNVYGRSKLDGDCLVEAEALEYYIFRLSVLVGTSPRGPQFLERMINQARTGISPRVAHDIVCSPSYALDVADAVRAAVVSGRPFGLYHLANAGQASLWELVDEAVRCLGLNLPVLQVSHDVFPSIARKALVTPLGSERMESLRPWREALRASLREAT
jgi:dTDP-4-dehydrorhamnose reductase